MLSLFDTPYSCIEAAIPKGASVDCVPCTEKQVGFNESGTGIIERDFPPHGLLSRLESRGGGNQYKIVPWSVGTESSLHKS